MVRAMLRFAVVALVAMSACATNLLDEDGGASDGAVPDLAVPDLAVAPDLAKPVADLASCIPPGDAATPGCPCGAQGLCRPATGRLVVQTATASGSLSLEVMDDNGCNRRTVSFDFPLGTPRWAADHERIAYIAAKNNSTTLEIMRVDGKGQITCRTSHQVAGKYAFTDVAWIDDHTLLLFSPSTSGIARFATGIGITTTTPVPEEMGAPSRFDVAAGGPLIWSANACTDLTDDNTCTAIVYAAPTPTASTASPVVTFAHARASAVRLDASAPRLVVETSNSSAQPLAQSTLAVVNLDGTMLRSLHAAGHLPAFALDGRAVVYTTDTQALRFQYLDTLMTEDIPPAWKTVFSPDWAPTPASCQTVTTCD